MKNKYKIDGQTLIVYNRKDNKEMLFDAEDFDLVKQYTWYINNGYGVYNTKRLNGKQSKILAHRLVMNSVNDLFIDHINHNRADNRKLNLRLVTHQQNNHNQKNTKGYYYSKSRNKWCSCIRADGKLIHLGSYNTEAEARVAYLEAKKKYHPTAPIQGY